MIYGSVCSGIEAATVAWHPLGWRAAWYAEIEKFPCAVLKHHYPDVPNLGDMTKIHERSEFHGRPIDLLVGGTPCQSFSVAGLRKGLADPRGNLALVFLGILARTRARWVVWENVPGLLSSESGRDFGAFLGGLAQLGYGWAYRVLDAEYFGVPQRRNRIFVVGYLGDWRRAAAVLFESHGLSGHPPPSRKKGQPDPGEVSRSLKASGGFKQDTTHETYVAHTLRGEGFDASEDGSGRGTPVISCESGQGYWREGAGPLRAEGENRPSRPGHVVCFEPGIMARDGGHVYEDVAGTLRKEPGDNAQVVAFGSKDSGADALADVAPTLRAGGHDASHPNGGVPPAVVYDMRGRGDGETVPTLCSDHASRPSDYCPVAFTIHGTDKTAKAASETEVAGSLRTKAPGSVENSSTTVALSNTHVRRLTPKECERLQGFSDDYTLIPYGGKAAKDGPRYKAIGNSMAVPVMAWIGKRIAEVDLL